MLQIGLFSSLDLTGFKLGLLHQSRFCYQLSKIMALECMWKMWKDDSQPNGNNTFSIAEHSFSVRYTYLFLSNSFLLTEVPQRNRVGTEVANWDCKANSQINKSIEHESMATCAEDRQKHQKHPALCATAQWQRPLSGAMNCFEGFKVGLKGFVDFIVFLEARWGPTRSNCPVSNMIYRHWAMNWPTQTQVPM